MLRNMYNSYILLFFMLLSVGLAILYLFKDRYSMVNLRDIYNDFYSKPSLDSRMLFNIEIDGCKISGVYEGDDFRRVTSSGENVEKCRKYNYSMGDDPNKFVNSLVGYDFASEQKRNKIKSDERERERERNANQDNQDNQE